MRSRRLWAALAAVTALGALAVGVIASSSGSSSESAGATQTGFKPGSLKGKWTGTWNNKTFGTTGAILAGIRFKDGKLIPRVDFSGDVFGCQNPPADTVTLKKGKGDDRYSKKGFKVNEETDAFGELELTYKHKGNKLTGEGSAPSCDPSITYELTGKLTQDKLNATVTVHFPASAYRPESATTKLSAKQP